MTVLILYFCFDVLHLTKHFILMTPMRPRMNVKNIQGNHEKQKKDRETFLSCTPYYNGFIKVYQNLLDTP